MGDIGSAVAEAARLIAAPDSTLYGIVLLSLQVSLTAVVAATAIGLPLGAAIAIRRFPGRPVLLVTLNSLMGLPPVVVGLLVYLLLSRAGPLGDLGLLFTPTAMVIAQTILVTPIIAGLSRQVLEDAWHEYEEQLRSLGRDLCDGGGDIGLGHALFARHGRARGIRARGGRSRRCDDRRRQHRRRDARDDDDHLARNEQRRSAARAGSRHHPRGRGVRDQRSGADHQVRGACAAMDERTCYR